MSDGMSRWKVINLSTMVDTLISNPPWDEGGTGALRSDPQGHLLTRAAPRDSVSRDANDQSSGFHPCLESGGLPKSVPVELYSLRT